MIDDWAYQEVYGLQPQGPPPVAPVADTPQNRRDRALSIVRTVASASLDFEPPPLETRPRASSLTEDSALSLKLGALKIFQDAPLTLKESSRAWDRKRWLGAAYDPSLVGFDEELWSSQVNEYIGITLEARLASRLGDEQRLDARAQLQQIQWISHELQDIQEHDIAPLDELAKRADVLSEKQKLVDTVKWGISEAYDALEHVERLLRSPAPRVVPKLAEIFDKIDKGLAFCDAHPDFAQSGQTSQGLRNCTKRALEIAKAYTVHELRKITEKIAAKAHASPAAAKALVYAKFEADAAHCAPVISLVSSHARNLGGMDLVSVFVELQTEYFNLRTQLIADEAVKLAEPLLPFSELNDAFFDAARSSMVEFKQLFNSEERVFAKLFGGPTPELGNWLVDLCDPLYSALRRLIIHATDVGRLGQLIVLVHSESEDGAERDELDQTTPSTAVAALDPFQAVYVDAQQRLVFRADLIIDSFGFYVPSAKDFNRARYPVVDQALGLLSQVYQLISAKIFNDLAHRCIRECVSALDIAVANRVAASGLSGAAKVHLFHIKQLLILQSHIMEFDLEQTVLHEVDFSGIRRLLELPRGYSFRELLSLAWDSVPQVVEYMFDAMEELYASLRRALDRLCGALVQKSGEALTGKGTAEEHAAKFRDSVADQIADLKPAIAEHIGDPRVASVLLDSVQDALVKRYAEFYDAVPSGERTERLMDPETFSAWVGSNMAEDP